ncbi:hypothetical protein ACHQM5_026315 [Ranunculus cassubicifolius]
MGFSLFSSFTNSSKPKTAYIFDIQGQLQRLTLPITVAEMMLEAPGSIVCAMDELRISRVITALRADDELQARKFYAMFPAKKANSKVSESYLENIKAACRSRKRSKKGTKSGPKVAPIGNEEERDANCGNLLGDDHCDTGFPGCRSSSSKKWRPMLQPIHETS